MFVAQAHSFTQQARLAITLAWVAGYTNIITIMACGTVTSHASGTTSNLGRDLVEGLRGTEGAWRLAWYALFLLGTFLLGAIVSGATTELGRHSGWKSIYVLPMAIEALLLAAFATGLEFNGGKQLLAGPAHYWMVGAASMAMGLQNATITRISSGVVRTTHVTGVITDLGLEFVQFVWWLVDRTRNVPPAPAQSLVRSVRAHPSAHRLVLLASIIGSFALGAGLGTICYDAKPRLAMTPAVLFLIWIVYQDLMRPIADIEVSDAASDGAAARIIEQLPTGLAVYHLRRDKSRAGRAHRMPDLDAWAERLPASVRVVVLDLGEGTELDANAATNLRSILDRLSGWGRKLVLAGVSSAQYEQLRRAGANEHLDPTCVCGDLEMGIARGLMLLEQTH